MLNSLSDTFQLNSLRKFYNDGEMRSYVFRKKQLAKLKQTISEHEEEIYAALYTDLKKSREEAWVSEIGLIMMEIKYLLRHLEKWMRPQTVQTNLVNFPSASKIYKDPLGVVLLIGPWNYPVMLNLLPLAGAIAGGNCVVVKPSEMAPASTAIVKKIIESAFHPDHVRVVEGDGAMVVPVMMNEFRFDHIFYTGSIPVGRSIYKQAAEQLIPVTLELGGKSPAIVEADADITVAARRITVGKFLNAGQTCIAPDYVLVHHSQKDELVKEMIRSIHDFYGKLPGEEYGKIINEKRFDTLVGYLQSVSVIHGGEADRERLFIAPTLVDEPGMDHRLMKEEIFGPILPIISFNSFDEALSIVRQNDNPLSLYLFTKTKTRKNAWLQSVAFGSGCINNADWQFANLHLPFGGVGNSGLGRYHGRYSFETFTRQKPVMETPNWPDPSIRYPPLKGKLGWFKKLIG